MGNEKERRSQPRAHLSLDFHVQSGDNLLSATTTNVSAKGLSCVLGHYIPLFTKLNICLMIPDPSDQTHEETMAVNCEGAVVRAEEEPSENSSVYRTAVFFTNLDENSAAKLNEYIEAHKDS